MSLFIEVSVIKDTLHDGLRTKITKNEMSERFFIEFSTENRSIVLQKNFQDNLEGRKLLNNFETTIKSIKDLKKYFNKKGSK